MKTDLTPKQINTLNKWVYSNINKEELEEFYKHYLDNFENKHKISLKKFKNIFIDYILNGFENNNFKIFDDYNHLENEKFYRLELFKDELNQKNTDELINHDDDNEEFNNFEYLDYDFILEDNLYRFKQNKINYEEHHYNNDLFIKIEFLEGVLNDLKYYDNFKEFLEDLENLIYNNGFNLENCFLNFVYEYTKFNFNQKTDFNKLNEEIKKDIKTELEKRKNLYIKDNLKQNRIIRSIKEENLKENKPIIKKSLLCFEEKNEKHKEFIKNELNKIREYLKNGK